MYATQEQEVQLAHDACSQELAATSHAVRVEGEVQAQLAALERRFERHAHVENEALERVRTCEQEAFESASAAEEHARVITCEIRQELTEKQSFHASVEARVESSLAAKTTALQQEEDQFHVVETQAKRALEEEECQRREEQSLVVKVGNELHDRCEALVLATRATDKAECRTFVLEEELARKSHEMMEANVALSETASEARCERAEAMLAGTEALAHRALAEEMREVASTRRDLRERLEVGESRERACRLAWQEDRSNLLAECDRLLEQGRSEVFEAQALHDQDTAKVADGRRLAASEKSAARRYQTVHREAEVLCDVFSCENHQLIEEKDEVLGLLRGARQQLNFSREEWRSEYSAAQREELFLQRELAAAHGREAAVLQELERLRDVVLRRDSTDACISGRVEANFTAASPALSDGSSQHVAQDADQKGAADASALCKVPNDVEAEKCDVSDEQRAAKGPSARTERIEVRRLQRQLIQEREQREQLRARFGALEKDAAQLRQRARDADAQLKLTREESERRRALIASLHERCAAASAACKEEQEIAHEGSEAVRQLQLAKRDLGRRNAAIRELGQEISETRHRQAERSQQEQAEASRAEAEAARSRALRAEAQRREQALRDARAEAQVLQARLAAEESEARARSRPCSEARRPLRGSKSDQFEGGGRPIESSALAERPRRQTLQQQLKRPLSHEAKSVGSDSINAGEIAGRRKGDSRDAEGLAAFNLARESSLVGCAATQGDATSVSSSLPATSLPSLSVTLPSPIDVATLEDSLQILNLRREDLSAFLNAST
eukprot:TRINITY_DN75489_c0_g1_i1.p1 TRINITY_DN75489_c0_g1~~TRINITY_DN75489_c0_g1_i1.p1  ORF type:complete len:868 (-),score=189.53 TRINITY_DN75489_c0_g1_i1:147-2534(-)